MKKLKTKVFWTLFSILTIVLLGILLVYNYKSYIKEKNDIISALDKMNNHEFNDSIKDLNNTGFNGPRMFIDKTMYTILLDKNNNISKIVSHSNNSITMKAASKIVNKALDNNNDDIYVGNLYTNKYSYSIKGGKYILVVDNTSTNKELVSDLVMSGLFFIFSETVIIIISNLITNWIVKPVIESFNKQKEFTENASHELKTPLAIIMASSEALEKDNDKKWLRNIQTESEKMNKLIINLLTLSKMENANYALQKEEVNLSKLVELSILPFESITFEKKVKLNYDIKPDVKFNCNSDEIKKLIGILVDNAIKHTPENKKIKLELKEEKDLVTILVINEGSTISKNMEEKIFDRFYREDESRNRNEERFGLGLAIAKAIVTNHNGKISASSKNNKTTFIVEFKKK